MHYGGLNDNMQGKPLKEFRKDYLHENSTHACVLLYSCMCAVTYYRTGIYCQIDPYQLWAWDKGVKRYDVATYVAADWSA